MVRLDTSSPFVYTFIITISYWCWIAFEIWLVARERGGARMDSQDRGSRNTIILWWVVAIVIGIFAVPNVVPRFIISGNAVALNVIGTALIWMGISLRFWSVQKLGRFFRSKVVIQDMHELVKSDPYKYIRNPSYTEALITLVGFDGGIGNWLSIIVLLTAGLLSFVRRIAVEDKALADRFGNKYVEYRSKTWALVPFVW